MTVKLNWLITGPGAISGLLAAGLLRQQQQVAWLSRHTQEETSVNWTLTENGKATRFVTPLYPDAPPPDAVILAVKSYDLAAALERLDELQIATDCPIIISHNGMLSVHSERPLFPLITTHAASRENHAISHNGYGESWLAAQAINQPQPLASAIGEILQQSFPPLHLVHDIEHRRWHKLLINCVINPLTAIYRVANGELAAARFSDIKQQLIEEFVQVAAACGYSFDAHQASQAVAKVITATAANRSSMLVDVEHQRTTEIDAMNGFIVEQARQHQIDVPTHRAVTEAVTALR